MQRPISAFKMDEHGDWVAFLSCGHKQHVRHQPPFFDRPWVTTEQGRREKIGELLNCVQCDRFEMPENFAAYRKTAEFTEKTIPKGLLDNHSTKPGIWGRIHVIEGKLIYRVDALDVKFEISPGAPGIVIPEIKHHIEPVGPVTFFVEFYRSLLPAAK
jgi:tellurite methyltransferase